MGSNGFKLVVIESPYAGTSPPGTDAYKAEVEANLEYLRDAMADCLYRDEAPFASHALYTQPGVLDDTIAEERKRGINAGFDWAAKAEKTVVYMDRGISKGMYQGMINALQAGREIEIRFLASEETIDPTVLQLADFINATFSIKCPSY